MRRKLLILLAATVAALVLAPLELFFVPLEAGNIEEKLLVLFFGNLTLFVLLAMIYFSLHSLSHLCIERRRRIPGYRFKTRVVLLFVVLTSIPSAVLLILSLALGTRYIERLFTPRFSDPLEESMVIARQLYDIERRRTLNQAAFAAAGNPLPPGYRITYLDTPSPEAEEPVQTAFEGGRDAAVITLPGGREIVRAAVPATFSPARLTNAPAPAPDTEGGPAAGGREETGLGLEGEAETAAADADAASGSSGPAAPGAPDREGAVEAISGVMVVEQDIPPELSSQVRKLRSAYEDYLRLETWETPLKWNFLFIMIVFGLLIFFLSLLTSLRLASRVTVPVASLATATRRVAEGDLSVNVKAPMKDEIGMLIESFNGMVKGLRESKSSLQKAYIESDRRRLYLESILENIQSGVIFLNRRLQVQTVNSSALRMLGLRERDVVGGNYSVIFKTLRSEELENFVRGIQLTDFTYSERNLRAEVDGHHMALRVSITAIRESLGEHLGILVVFDDLTELIKAQRAIAWQEVARRMAHEIKNPLTPIKLSAERMSKKWAEGDEAFPAIFERASKTIIREVDSLKKMVDEFSRFGKLPRIEKKAENLSAILSEVVSLYSGYTELEIKLRVDPALVVPLDAEQFKRAIINIVDNAVRAMERSGRLDITVETREIGRVVLIRVADQGPGLSEEEKELIFQPYYSTRREGTGLGLPIVERIIAEHGGSISVRDNSPRGAVFLIEVPGKEE